MEAKHLLTVNLNAQVYPNQLVERSINYRGSYVSLTEKQYETLVSSFPEYWHSEKDKLIRFVVYEDGTYFCERLKKVFNFSIRETEDKYYIFNSAPQDQVDALFSICTSFYNSLKLQSVDNLYDTVLSSIGDLSYMKYNILSIREKLLKESDYLFLSDYTFVDEEEKQKWKEYRQELRDITDTQAWKDHDYSNIVFPVSPSPKEQLYVIGEKLQQQIAGLTLPDNLLQEMQDEYSGKPVEEIVKEFAQITVKIELLTAISKLKLPMADLELTNMYYENPLQDMENQSESGMISVPEVISRNAWDLLTSNITEKIRIINEQMKRYDIDFTINDLLNRIIEENKEIMRREEYTEDAVKLINELQIEGDIA